MTKNITLKSNNMIKAYSNNMLGLDYADFTVESYAIVSFDPEHIMPKTGRLRMWNYNLIEFYELCFRQSPVGIRYLKYL